MSITQHKISAPHLGVGAVLQADILWQNAPMTALLFHPNPTQGGTMDSKVVTTLYRHCRDQGYNVVRYNSRGVGSSSGVATATDDEFLDALCVYHYIKDSKMTSKWWLGGFSFGGYMACLLADYLPKDELARLMLVAPSVVKHKVDTLDIDWQKARLIYGDQDGLIAPSALADFGVRHAIKTQVIAGAGHPFHKKLTDLKQALLALDTPLIQGQP